MKNKNPYLQKTSQKPSQKIGEKTSRIEAYNKNLKQEIYLDKLQEVKTLHPRRSPKKIFYNVNKVLRKISSPNHKNFWELKKNWNLIIGDDLCDYCFVKTIKKIGKKNILYIGVNSGAITVEIQARKNIILKNLNDNFYNLAISDIMIKN